MTEQDLDASLARLEWYRDHWKLTPDGLPFATHTCVLQPVRYRGQPAMLKIATNDEERRGASLMQWWDGAGAARVFAIEGDALLMERACGDRSLTDMVLSGKDDEASLVMCDLAARLHGCRGEVPTGLIPLSRRFESLASAAKTHAGIFQEAAFIVEKLLATQQDIVVLRRYPS